MTDCNESEEAREIAKKLRYTANDDLGGLSLQKNLAVITKAEDGSWRGVMRRLADLIDRPTAKQEHNGAYWRCAHCGAFTRKDAVVRDGLGVVPLRCCGNCGREWE